MPSSPGYTPTWSWPSPTSPPPRAVSPPHRMPTPKGSKAMRWVRARVLPDPAPATIRTGPSVCRTASRWTGFNESRSGEVAPASGSVSVATRPVYGGAPTRWAHPDVFAVFADEPEATRLRSLSTRAGIDSRASLITERRNLTRIIKSHAWVSGQFPHPWAYLTSRVDTPREDSLRSCPGCVWRPFLFAHDKSHPTSCAVVRPGGGRSPAVNSRPAGDGQLGHGPAPASRCTGQGGAAGGPERAGHAVQLWRHEPGHLLTPQV